jgi:PhzF family phenazine biosynthesis protein
MLQKSIIVHGTYRLETKAGVLKVAVQENGDVYLSQALPQFYERVDKVEVAESLRINPEELCDDLPVQIVSTGLRDLMVPIRSQDALYQIQPDFDRIEEICRKYDIVGYHLFTLDTSTDALASCRNFAPLYGIPEESATGTSNGALLCYLHQYGKVTESHAREVLFEQGYTMNRPSEIKGKLILGSDNQVVEVQVGGATANLERRVIER